MGLWEACGFPSALGPSHQAFLWDLSTLGPGNTPRPRELLHEEKPLTRKFPWWRALLPRLLGAEASVWHTQAAVSGIQGSLGP